MSEADELRARAARERDARLQAEEIAERATRELYERQLELERSNAELQAFAATVSHDLVEPLRTISGFADLLQARAADRLDEPQREFLGYIADGATRAQELVAELLAFARAGTTPLRLEDVPLAEVLAAVTAELDRRLRESGARLTADEPLPVVHADRGEIGRVLQNLVANAVKYVGSGVVPEVHVGARDAGDGTVELTVADNGVGIPAQDAEAVFDMFTRLDSEVRLPGSGIGLATCRKIVEHHGGRIWVTSREGGGSVFHFTLSAR